MRHKLAALVAGLFAVATPAAAEDVPDHPATSAASAPQLALMGTIPIYWGEADGLSEIIGGTAHPHWARRALEQDFTLVPLDFLSAEVLADKRYLLLAQPRALAPEENVVLDGWVREGGKLLLFADPIMTGHSRFPLGDRRRPMDVALLSPILAHWGLDLQFDEAQDADLRMLGLFAVPIPVRLPGQFVPADGRFECVVSGGGILAHCALGAGEVLALADAALLDLDEPHDGAGEALHMLTSHLFGPFGENWGRHAPRHGKSGETAEDSPELGCASHHPPDNGLP